MEPGDRNHLSTSIGASGPTEPTKTPKVVVRLLEDLEDPLLTKMAGLELPEYLGRIAAEAQSTSANASSKWLCTCALRPGGRHSLAVSELDVGRRHHDIVRRVPLSIRPERHHDRPRFHTSDDEGLLPRIHLGCVVIERSALDQLPN